MEVYDYQRVTPRLRDSQTRSYPVWWSSKFPSTSHQFWSYSWWPCTKIKTLTSLYKTFKYSTYETTHFPEKLTDQAMIQCWFCGIPEPNVCVWNSGGEVYHGLRCNKCGTLWKNQCQSARNHGKNRFLNFFLLCPQDGMILRMVYIIYIGLWHYVPRFHYGLKLIKDLALPNVSTRSTRFETTQRPRSPPLPDELQMSRQHAFDHLHGPLLQGLDGGLLCWESPKVRIS
jgi:hypothetical protein